MKDGLKEIIGRQVAAVIVARNDKDTPRHQVFLVFADGTNFEFWGDAFSCCGGVDRCRDIERYVASGGGRIVAVYANALECPPASARLSTGTERAPYHVPAPQRLDELMTRDLAAWNLAKQAILRARNPPRTPPIHDV